MNFSDVPLKPGSRVRLEMSLRDVVIEMSDGNPGALNVMMLVVREAEAIDPDAALGAFGVLCALDEHGIYGPDIWGLYKYVCGQSLPKMLAVLRAIQLGRLAGVTPNQLDYAIKSRGRGIDADAALAAVKERLPRFAVAEAAP